MSWKEKIANDAKSLVAIATLGLIVISGHLNGLNGDMTIAAIATLGTYAAIKKD